MIDNPEHYFYSKSGQVLKDIEDLFKCIKNISNEDFSHHVNSEKNDFANWVNDILLDKNFASALRKASSKDKMIEVVRNKYKTYMKSKNRRTKKNLISQIKEAYNV